MGLRGNVENRLRPKRPQAEAGEFRKLLNQSGKHRRVVGLHAAGSKSAIGAHGVVAEPGPEGAHQVLFDFDGQRAVAPSGKLGIKGGHQRVPGDAHGRWRGVEQPVIAGMRRVGLKLPKTLDKKIKGFDRINREREIEAGERGTKLRRIERGRDPAALQLRSVGFNRLRQLAPKFGARAGIKHQGRGSHSLIRFSTLRIPGSAGILPAFCAAIVHTLRAGCPRSRVFHGLLWRAASQARMAFLRAAPQ